METVFKESIVHLDRKQSPHEKKSEGLGEGVQLELEDSDNAFADGKHNGNGGNNQPKNAVLLSLTHCLGGDQADLGESSQLDRQRSGTERELDDSTGTDVETSKAQLLPSLILSTKSCRGLLSCEGNSTSPESTGYAAKGLQELSLESYLSDFGSSVSSGPDLVDMSESCMDRLIGTLDSPQPDSWLQKKESEQDNEVPEEDRCPSTFLVSCVATLECRVRGIAEKTDEEEDRCPSTFLVSCVEPSSAMDALPDSFAPTLEHRAEGIEEEPDETYHGSDQQSLAVSTTTAVGPRTVQSQLSPRIEFGIDEDKKGITLNDSNVKQLTQKMYTGSDFDKQQGPGVKAKQHFGSLRPTDVSLLTDGSTQILSKEHQQVLQLLGLNDDANATADPADFDLDMSSLSQDFPAALPLGKDALMSNLCNEMRAQIVLSVSDSCEEGSPLTSSMDPKPPECDVTSMQDGFFFNLEDNELPPHHDNESDMSVTSSCDSPPPSPEVGKTPTQSACGAAECMPLPKEDSVCQTQQMPCSIDSYISGDYSTGKPDIDVGLSVSPNSSFDDFSVIELPAKITMGEKQLKATSLISQGALATPNTDVSEREYAMPQVALDGCSTDMSREKCDIFENSDSNSDAVNRRRGSNTCIGPASDPTSLTQSSVSYSPVAAPRRKRPGGATSCFTAGESGGQEPQPHPGLQDQRRAMDTTCHDLPQSSFVKPSQDRAFPNHLTQQPSLRNSEVDLFTVRPTLSTPDMSQQGNLYLGDQQQLTSTSFTASHRITENHGSPAVPGIGFGQNRFTPKPQESQLSETHCTGVQFLMQKTSWKTSVSQEWSVITPGDTPAQPSPQEFQSCLSVQGEFILTS